VGEGDASSPWGHVLRLAVLASSALVIVPFFFEPPRSSDLVSVFLLLAPAVILELLMALLPRRQERLVVAGLSSALLVVVVVRFGGEALGDVPESGWYPVVWAVLVGVFQLMVAVSALRAVFLAPSSGLFGYVWVFIEALAIVTVWSILVPTRGDHRIVGESAAIGDSRTVISAQAAYASATGGCYGDMPCLSQPTSCIPDYPADAPVFIGTELSSLADKDGYRRTYIPGPPAHIPRCFATFAYTALPTRPGRTGVRSFCADDTGIVCVNDDGAPFAVAEGRCPQGCKSLN
jgi:hypothetical protein